MMAFNFMSHGTQDIYPTFLQVQHNFSADTVRDHRHHLQHRRARRRHPGRSALRADRAAAGDHHLGLLALPMVPLWAFSHTAGMLALGAFAMQFFVQGAWGVIPAHLSELSPNALRGVFTGFAYQLGNLLASVNGTLQTDLGEHHFHGNYSQALALTVSVVLIAVAVITALAARRRASSLRNRPA